MNGRRALSLALLALCGCLDSGLVHCPDGTVCAADLVCAEDRPACVDPARIGGTKQQMA